MEHKYTVTLTIEVTTREVADPQDVLDTVGGAIREKGDGEYWVRGAGWAYLEIKGTHVAQKEGETDGPR